MNRMNTREQLMVVTSYCNFYAGVITAVLILHKVTVSQDSRGPLEQLCAFDNLTNFKSSPTV